MGVNSDLHTRMNFSKNDPQFGHTISKIFAKPVLGRQSLKNVGFKKQQIISLPGAPTFLGPALHAYPRRVAALRNGTTLRFSVPYTKAFYNTNSNQIKSLMPKWRMSIGFIYNETNQMHQFPKFTPAWNSTCFGQFLCPSSGVYSLYTRHWYMSYRSADSFRAGPEWNCNSIVVLLESCLQTCMT